MTVFSYDKTNLMLCKWKVESDKKVTFHWITTVYRNTFCNFARILPQKFIRLYQLFQEHFDKTGVRVLVLCPGATATSILDEITEKSLDFVEKNAVKTMQESLLVQP